MEKKVSRYQEESSMTVGQEKATMIGVISVNEKTGNVKITYSMTTRHLSFNDDVQAQVASELAKLHKAVYEEAVALHKSWIEEKNRIDGVVELNFPDDLEEGEPAKDDEANPGKKKAARKSGTKVVVK